MAKAKGEPCVYGVKEPTNVNQVSQDYIVAFLEDKLEKGEIKQEQVEEFLEKKGNLPFTKARKVFVKMFMADIRPKTEKPSFDDRLKALITKK